VEDRVVDSFVVELADDRNVAAVRAESFDELPAAAHELGLEERIVVVLVGGAGAATAGQLEQVRPVFEEVLAPLVQGLGATVIDGGTDAGVMELMGSARARGGHAFPLVGVVVEAMAKVAADGHPDAAELEPHHTQFVLVPGAEWGDEAPWLARLATVVSGSKRSVTVLVNGGEIAWEDVRHSVEAGRPVVVLDGSGRTADVLAAAARGAPAGIRANSLVASGLVLAVPSTDPRLLGSCVRDLLGEVV
jgi:SLOG in TRPM, prokaryote